MKALNATFNTVVSTLEVNPTGAPEFIDITDQVNEAVRNSGINNGIAVVFSRHTTAAVTIQENEPLLLNDLATLLERLSPRNSRYGHNDFSIRTVHMQEDECPNGHSHCQHIVLGTSESIPVISGELPLGQWQRIFVVELDDQKSRREVLIQIMGV